MKSRTHSILVVVNAHADVERSLQERSDVGNDWQNRCSSTGNPPTTWSNRLAKFNSNKGGTSKVAKTKTSWGILFSAEYFWAPDIGPMLIVCPPTINAPHSSPAESGGNAIGNCCILQFAAKLSTCRSLRVFHGY